MRTSPFKALALLSGGLDSILAVKIIQEQNISVEAVSFQSPFFRNKQIDDVALKLGIRLHKIDMTREILAIIQNPVYGFGKNLNPCIDCHLSMIKRSGEFLKEIHADFLITGEVLGERPKSQNTNALNLIAKRSGFGDILVRPLSAKKLKITRAEEEGFVDREKLLDLAGRSREPQLALAKKYGIDYFPQPAGGCLLTDPCFCDRLRHSLRLKKMNALDIGLLQVGRHFLTGKGVKIIVGRDDAENRKIRDLLKDEYYLFELKDAPGPVTVLCTDEPDEESIIPAASLTARYSRFRGEKSVEVVYYRKNEEPRCVTIVPRTHLELNLKLI
ncbi:MAG: tRNA 4-thiouridine(8) synthase ThiI [bacterium]|nr:tRNA 4-thiouridine(8) synthase ThiI [bacterium]